MQAIYSITRTQSLLEHDIWAALMDCAESILTVRHHLWKMGKAENDTAQLRQEALDDIDDWYDTYKDMLNMLLHMSHDIASGRGEIVENDIA